MTIESLRNVLSIVEVKGVYFMLEQSGHHPLISKDLAKRIIERSMMLLKTS